MKKLLLGSLLFLGAAFGMNAQVTVSGDITTNTTWTSNNIYMLTGGFVYVTNNATLTIEPGTLIKGNASTLVITRGAKLIADGTPTKPIVFTSYQPAGSRAPADWGGVYLLGKAPINDPAGERLGEGGIDAVKGLYGGTDPNDNSGIIRYVRIEFGGIAYLPNNETNGLTMGGVGAGTIIDYVQVSFGGDDAFEWFGGTVDCKHLIANRTLDDMFDTDYGYSGHIQFAIGLSDSNIADVSLSNAFESDNDAGGSINAPLTHAIISNVSIFGPKRTSSTPINPNYGRGGHLRRSTSQCIYNSLITGFPTGLKIEGPNTVVNVNNKALQFKNNIIAGCPTRLDSSNTATTGTGSPNWTSWNGWFTVYGNTQLPNSMDVMAMSPYTYTNPNFLLQVGSPALTGASFTSPNLNNPFFTQTTYRGAMDGTNDWTKCWTNWDPQNTPYTTPGIDYMPLAVSAGGPTTFCQGGQVTLTATSSATMYSWSNSSTTTAITVNTSGNYTVTASNTAGCVATSAPISVTVNPLPTVTVTPVGNTTFCQGGSVTLNSSTGSTYSWSTGATTSSIVASNSGNYFVTITDANGCSNTSSNVAVTVNPLPSATITANGNTSFCTGDSVQLCANSATSYMWSNNATTQCIYVNSTGAYTVQITDANGCMSNSSAPVSVNVSSSPAPTVNPSGPQAICQGQTITLTSSSANTYSWSNGATTQSIVVSTAGTYNVTVTNTNACSGTGTSANVVVTVNPLPTAGFTSTGTVPTINFTNTSTGASTYLWDFGDFSNSTLQNPSHTYGTNGVYNVCLTATTSAGCTAQTCNNVNINVGVQEEVENLSTVSLYPNPLNEQATLEFVLNSKSDVSITIFNLEGKAMFSEMSSFENGANKVSIDASAMPAGIYFTRITTDNVTKTIKTMVIK